MHGIFYQILTEVLSNTEPIGTFFKFDFLFSVKPNKLLYNECKIVAWCSYDVPSTVATLEALCEKVVSGDFAIQIFLVFISQPITDKFFTRIDLKERMDIILCLYR